MEGSPTIDLADSGDYKLGYCQTEYDALLSIGFDSQGATGKNIPRQKARRFFGAPAGISPIGDKLRLPGRDQKKYPPPKGEGIFFGAPAGIRTPDTLLKRQVLCLLSYWGISV